MSRLNEVSRRQASVVSMAWAGVLTAAYQADRDDAGHELSAIRTWNGGREDMLAPHGESIESIALRQVRPPWSYYLLAATSGSRPPRNADDCSRADVMAREVFDMGKLLLKVQVAVLALGTVFSWFTLVIDYRRFFAAGGLVFEVSGCAVANPLVTPCFYGALAFLAAFLWAVAVLRSAPEVMTMRQRGLNWLLIAGTVFAWGNFAYEVYRFSQPQPSPSAFSCPSEQALVHPLMTPCFYGAMIYLTSLVISILILRAHTARA